jgi:catechol 2,3-dioxygenase-like lactoylglutathione lyase family enzyme
MIKCLAHVCLLVSDLNVAEDFYCNKLGLKRAFEFRKPDGTRTGMYVHVGGRNFVELFQGVLSPRAEGQPYKHLCLEVDDFEGTVAELRSRGLSVDGVKVGGDKSWQAWIVDPDGNRIELHGYTPQSDQTPWLTKRPRGGAPKK